MYCDESRLLIEISRMPFYSSLAVQDARRFRDLHGRRENDRLDDIGRA